MTDYIKREDAIRAMAQYMMDMALIDNPEASDRIEEWEGNIAAPVMSTVKAADVVERDSEVYEWCTDCKEYDKERHCCPRWNKVIRDTVDEIKKNADVVEVGKEYLFKDGYQVIASTEGYFAIERVDSKYDNSELVLKRDGKFDCWNC